MDVFKCSELCGYGRCECASVRTSVVSLVVPLLADDVQILVKAKFNYSCI